MELTEHKFIQKLIGDRMYYHKNKKESSNLNFCINVHKEVIKITNTLTDLKLIRQLIAEIHPNSKVNSNSIIRPEILLKYHTENYFLRIMTYKDQLLKLISTVYQWEIKDGIGYEKRLLKKANEENINLIAKLIQDVNTMLSSVREIRNKIAHGEKLDNVDILLLQLHSCIEDFIDSYPNLNFNKEKYLDSKLTSEYFASTIMENLKEMMQIEEDMATNLFFNLDFLYTQYTLIIPDEHALNI